MIIIDKSKLKEINFLKQTLLEQGIFKIESYLTTEINNLKEEVLKYHKTHGNNIHLGQLMRLMPKAC